MPKLNFNTLDEFLAKYKELIDKNPDYSPQEVYEKMIGAKATIGWKALEKINFNADAAAKIKSIIDWDDWWTGELLDFEEWYVAPEEASPEWETINWVEEEAPTDFISQSKWEDWDSNTWQKKLEIFCNEYNQILKDAANYVNEHNHWEWLVWKWTEEFNETLNWYKKQLEALEQSPEFTQLMKDISEAWTWTPWDNGIMNANVNQTLRLAASWLWSKMFNDKDRVWNYLSEFVTSWPAKFMNELASWSQGWNWWSLLWALPAAAYSIFAWEDAQDIAKEYLKNNKGAKWTSSDEESKWKKFREKNPNVDIKKATDKMLFWDEAANSWVDNYINTRDDKLATLLKVKWAESPEEIDKFLNQYPSWQNAKQEWKDETLKRLSEKVSNVKYDDVAKQVKDVKSKKEDKKEDKKEEKVWDNWTPSNDDSINWTEKSSLVKDAIDIASWKKKLTKDDILWILPDKVKQLVEWVDKEAKTRLKNKETMLKNKDWVWKTDENWYRNPDSPINEVEEVNEKWGKGNVSEHKEQTPENNKYLHINETVKNLGSDKERIDYLKKHWFVVDKKTGFYTKNWMKTKVYKDWQYNPKWVKPDKKEWYNDRTLVEPSKKDGFQIALQKSWYKGPRDANWNFLPITDEWLDLQEAKKKESKTKK